MPQALRLLNSGLTNGGEVPVIRKLLKDKTPRDQALDVLFLEVLARYPTAEERKEFTSVPDGDAGPDDGVSQRVVGAAEHERVRGESLTLSEPRTASERQACGSTAYELQLALRPRLKGLTMTRISESRLTRREMMKLAAAGVVGGASASWFKELAQASQPARTAQAQGVHPACGWQAARARPIPST